MAYRSAKVTIHDFLILCQANISSQEPQLNELKVDALWHLLLMKLYYRKCNGLVDALCT